MKDENDRLVEQWLNDDEFRAEVRANPRAAAKILGIALDAEALSDWSSERPIR
jgi:hypothetical protein